MESVDVGTDSKKRSFTLPAVSVDEANVDVVGDGDKVTMSAAKDAVMATDLKVPVDGVPAIKDNLTNVD